MDEAFKSREIEEMDKRVANGEPATLNAPASGDRREDTATDRPSAFVGDFSALQELFGSPTFNGVTDAPTRGEIDAKLAAAEARTETRFVQLDSKIDRLADAVAGLSGLNGEIKDLRADNKFTRWTIAGMALTTLLGLVGVAYAGYQAALAGQANILAAFQAVLAAKPPH